MLSHSPFFRDIDETPEVDDEFDDDDMKSYENENEQFDDFEEDENDDDNLITVSSASKKVQIFLKRQMNKITNGSYSQFISFV